MWETDLTFCISEMASAGQPGFYLIMGMGSEQACLTEFKGSIVPKVAVDRFRVLSSKVAYCNRKMLSSTGRWIDPHGQAHPSGRLQPVAASTSFKSVNFLSPTKGKFSSFENRLHDFLVRPGQQNSGRSPSPCRRFSSWKG